MAIFGSGSKPAAYSWERERDQDVPDLEPLDPVDVVAADAVEVDQDKTAAKPRRRKPHPVDQPDQVQDPAEVVDVDKRLRAIARRVRSAHKRSVACVLEIGAALAEAQDLLADLSGGGSFNRWLTDNVSVTRQTAYRWVAAYRWVGSSSPALQAQFEISALTTLAAASTPEAARQEAVQLAESGQAVTGKLAKQLVAKHKPAKPNKPKPVSLVLGGGAVVVRSKPGVDVVDLLEQALAEARRTRSAAA